MPLIFLYCNYSNLFELVRKPPPNNARTRRIVAAIGSSILAAIIRLAVETAVRRGGIVSLRWEHIDLKDRVAHLPKTKNGESRDVPLSSKG